MAPRLYGIDHIHVNVSNRAESERWYNEVLGFSRVRELEFWAVDGGPLTLADASGEIRFALFESGNPQRATIALKVSSAGLTEWVDHLSEHGMDVTPVDHEVSWSVYFKDIDGNPFEITTHDYQDFMLGESSSQ